MLQYHQGAALLIREVHPLHRALIGALLPAEVITVIQRLREVVRRAGALLVILLPAEAVRPPVLFVGEVVDAVPLAVVVVQAVVVDNKVHS